MRQSTRGMLLLLLISLAVLFLGLTVLAAQSSRPHPSSIMHVQPAHPVGYGAGAVVAPPPPTKTLPQPQSTPRSTTTQLTTQTPTQTTSSNLDSGQWVWDGVSGFLDRGWRVLTAFFQQIIDWGSSYAFMYITPAVLSYKNPIVLAGGQWSLSAINGLVTLLLIIAGYQTMAYRSLELQERGILANVVRIVLAAVAANTGFYLLLPQLIDLCNFANLSFLSWIGGQASGDVSFPLGSINWIEQPITWAIFILIDFILTLLFSLVCLVRLALLDVCIILAPIWIILLANDTTRAWGRLGATTFFSALLVQPLQIIIIGFGASLISNFGHLNVNDPGLCSSITESAKQYCLSHLGNASVSASTTPVAIFVGIAAMYLAMKVPGMLFSGAVRSSVGQVNHDVGKLTKMVINGVLAGAAAAS